VPAFVIQLRTSVVVAKEKDRVDDERESFAALDASFSSVVSLPRNEQLVGDSIRHAAHLKTPPTKSGLRVSSPDDKQFAFLLV
jgi:hypothetical protein